MKSKQNIIIIIILVAVSVTIALGLMYHYGFFTDKGTDHTIDSVTTQEALTTDSINHDADTISASSLIKPIYRPHKSNQQIISEGMLGFRKARYFRYGQKEGSFPVFPVAFISSPNNKFVYIATYIPSASSGWIMGYQLFRYDAKLEKTIFVAHGAAIEANDKGITVYVGRCANEDEEPAGYEEEWVLHREVYDWNGQKIYVSKSEIDAATMRTKLFQKRNKGHDDGGKNFEERGYYVKGFIPCPEKYLDMTNEPM